MPVLGKRPNVFAAPVAKAYRPTMRDQAGSLLSSVLGNTYQGNRIARNVFGSSGLGGGQGNLLGGLGLLDLTPIGAAFALEEAGRQIGGGQPVTGAANVALGMVPIPAAAKAVKGGAKAVARAVLPNNLRLPAGASPPLDMSKAARMARAAEQGFTTPVYHGTPDAREIIDTGEWAAMHERFPGLGPAGAPGKRTYEVEHWGSRDRKTAASYADDRRAFDYQNAKPATLEAMMRLQNPLIIDAGGERWTGTMAAVSKARAGGHDGVIVRNVIDDYMGKGKPTTTYAVFSSDGIRLADDAFHPGGQARIAFPRPGDFRATGAPKPPTRRK
jgi:hypothetical protein